MESDEYVVEAFSFVWFEVFVILNEFFLRSEGECLVAVDGKELFPEFWSIHGSCIFGCQVYLLMDVCVEACK